MKVKLANPAHAAGLKDPHTRRSPFIDPNTGETLLEADVPESNYWVRRELDGSVIRVLSDPTGREPIAPITTRGGK